MGTQLSMETKLKNERDKWRHKDELHMKERVQREASVEKKRKKRISSQRTAKKRVTEEQSSTCSLTLRWTDHFWFVSDAFCHA